MRTPFTVEEDGYQRAL